MSVFSFMIVLSIAFFSLDFKLVIPQNFDKSSVSIAQCILSISIRELKFHPTLVVDKAEKDEDIRVSNILLDTIMKESINMNIPTIMTEEQNLTNRTVSGHVVKIKQVTRCDEFKKEILKANSSIKYIIIYDGINIEECALTDDIWVKINTQDIVVLSRDVENHEVINLLVAIPRIDPEACHIHFEKKLRNVNSCTNGLVDKNESVFPEKKPSNLQKCPLKIGMATLFPFARIENPENLTDYDPISNFSGSDVEIVKIVADYFNASPDYHYIHKEEKNPYVRTEFISLVVNGSLDIAAGGMYRIYGDIVEYSGIYSRQAVMWAYAVERGEKTWKVFITKVDGIYIFVIFYTCYTFLWFAFSKYDEQAVSLKGTLLAAWGCLVGASGLEDAITVKQKILNLFYLILCIHFSAYISVHLYSFLTIYGPPEFFKTNDELMESGRVPYLNNKTKYFVQDKKYIAFARTSGDCESFTACLNVSVQHHGASVILDSYFFPFQASTAINDEARLVRVSENVLTVYHEIVIRADHPLVKKIQKVILRLFESGICERLYSEAIGITTMAKAQIVSTNIAGNSYSCQSGCAITLSQAAGAFFVWIFGCVLSLCVFIVELLYNRERKIAFAL